MGRTRDLFKNIRDTKMGTIKDRNCMDLTKTRPGADCGSVHELLIAKFRLKLKKVGKTIRPFKYDLNQIP